MLRPGALRWLAAIPSRVGATNAYAVDGALAAAVAVPLSVPFISAWFVSAPNGAPTLLGALLNAGTVVPLIWRRRAPFSVAIIVAIFGILVSVYDRPGQNLQYGGLVVSIQAARAVCAETDCRVIMLTTFDQDDYVYDALYAGASGFLLKDVRRDDLVHAVRGWAAGEALLAPTVTRRLIRDIARNRPREGQQPAQRLAVLTARELEALRLLGRGPSNTDTA